MLDTPEDPLGADPPPQEGLLQACTPVLSANLRSCWTGCQTPGPAREGHGLVCTHLTASAKARMGKEDTQTHKEAESCELSALTDSPPNTGCS